MSSSKFVDDDRFDGLYMNVAQATQGIEPLLDSVFSFLRRKTDFFNGPPGSADTPEKGTEAAIQKVMDVLQKHADLHLKSKKASVPKKKKVATTTTTSTTKAETKKAVETKEEPVIEMGNDGGFDVSDGKEIATAGPILVNSRVAATSHDSQLQPPAEEPQKATEDVKISEQPPSKVSDDKPLEPSSSASNAEDDVGPPPVGNGGTVEGKYTWTQTLAELNVNVPVPDNTRGKDLNVVIAKKHLKVGLRPQQQPSGPGTKWIIDAPLCKPIVVDDSFWTVEDGNRLAISLQKSNSMEWWDCVCQGDPTINVRAIRPESSSVTELEGETRKTVEKMMYDQRQRALGLPSSDDEEKLAMLEKFKKQHPELDFSNAKFT